MRLRPNPLACIVALCLAPGLVALGAQEIALRTATASVVVSLRASVTVTDPHVCLAQVASIVGGDPGLRRQLAQLDLVDLSGGASVVEISREQVDFRIRLANVDPSSFRLQGAAKVEVRLAGGAVASAEVVAVARRAIMQRLPWKPEELVIEPVGATPTFAPFEVSAEQIHLEPEVRTSSMPLGRVRVDVAAYVGGQRRQAVAVQFDVKLLERVAVAARRIERGEILTEDKLRFDQRAVDRVDNYIASADSILGKKARIALGPGQLITATEVEAAVVDNPIIVHSRDLVHLVAQVGSLRITAVGEALQDGRAGQIIRVRNVDSGHMVLGRVRDRETVDVSF